MLLLVMDYMRLTYEDVGMSLTASVRAVRSIRLAGLDPMLAAATLAVMDVQSTEVVQARSCQLAHTPLLVLMVVGKDWLSKHQVQTARLVNVSLNQQSHCCEGSHTADTCQHKPLVGACV